MQQQSNLADFVSSVMRDKALSGYDVERRAGKRINQSYINRLKNGEARNPSTAKLKDLAIGLGVAEDEVFEAARSKNGIQSNIEILRITDGAQLRLEEGIKISQQTKEKILDSFRWILEGAIKDENNKKGIPKVAKKVDSQF